MPLDALEIFGWIGDAFNGWRYVFSPTFRQRTHKRWKAEGRGKAFIEILFGALGMVVTVLLVWLMVQLVGG